MHLHVGGAGELHGELMDPVSGPHRVGVPVHQAWGHHPHTSSAEHKIKKILPLFLLVYTNSLGLLCLCPSPDLLVSL